MTVEMSAPDPAPAPASPATKIAREPRGCMPSFLILSLMLAIPMGAGFAGALTEDVPMQPVQVTERLAVVPRPSWKFGGRDEELRAILLSRGSGSLYVWEAPGATSPAAQLRLVLDGWAGEPDVQIVAGPPVSFDAGPGRSGVRATYAGTFPDVGYPVEGQLAVVEASGTIAVFDAWAGEGEFRAIAGDVAAMIRDVRFSP